MENVWNKYEGKKRELVMKFSDDYKQFLNESKTEREAVKTTIKLAKEKGFKDFKSVKKVKAGDKLYFNNRDKSLALFVVGKKSIEEGMNILGAHIDSPRIDLKPVPLYEDNGLALFDTHYYGGIKNYQWVARAMAIHGVVCKKSGEVIEVCIGEKEDDPVVNISDLLIHLAKDQMSKNANTVVEGEDLNVLIGSIPLKTKEDKKDLIKENILSILKKDYNIEPEDFLSAELEIVPAGKARDLGLDRSMILGYGHDDRVCAYTSLRAILDVFNPDRYNVCILTDKEEIGSYGNTGAQSSFFENCVLEMLNLEGKTSSLSLAHALENSKMLSSDVSAAFDPNYASAFEAKNTAYFGKGISFNKYTGSRGKSGSSDACPEYIAKIRKILDDKKIMYQFSELGRVDQGGGGTIAYILANKNMDVLDAGIAVQNMHAPNEVVSKGDVYEAYEAYKVFLSDIA